MKILIVRTSAMGDIVHALPVLSALKAHDPRVRIAWLAESAFAPLLDGHPDLDLIIPVALRRWRRQPPHQVLQSARILRRSLRAFAPDVALDLMGNHKGALLARFSGAPRTIGARRSDRREPASALWLRETVPAAPQHAVDRMLSLLAPLGIEVATGDFDGAKILPQAQPLKRQRPYALIQAGAGWGNKQYPTAWWGAVARQLHDDTGLDILVPIAPGEEALATAVADASDGTATTVDAGPFSSLVALLRGSRLLLGGDTGPLHLAHALGTPVLCVMGPTDPLRNGPYRADECALWHQLPCSFCYKRFADTKACLTTIAPDQVAARARALLG